MSDDSVFREEWVRRWQDANPQGGKPAALAVASGIAQVEELISRGVPVAKATVLDFGCGRGRVAVGLWCQEVDSYIGLDVRPDVIEFARRLFVGLSGYCFYRFDTTNYRYNKETGTRYLPVPFSSDSFTLALAVSVFAHEVDDSVVSFYLGELRRVLEPGGHFLSTWLTRPLPEGKEGRWVVRESEEVLRLLAEWKVLETWGTGKVSDHWRVLAAKKE